MNPLLTGMNDKQAEAVQTTEGARGNNRNSQVKGQKASQVYLLVVIALYSQRSG